MSNTSIQRRSVSASSNPPDIIFHPLVWPLWLIAGAFTTGTNPLHNILLLLGTIIVVFICHARSPLQRAFIFFLRIGVVIIFVRVLLSTIAVGGFAYGQTPFGHLPKLQLPWWLGGLALGGQFTLEMLLLGLSGGIQLMTLLAVFGAFNAVADHYGLLRRTPSFLGSIGLAVTIALAFVPQTILQLVAIREAQRVRGHRFRGWRDALPLLVPLISGGLERSLQLAEAMDSRGYAGGPSLAHPSFTERALVALGGTLSTLGLFFLFYQPGLWFPLSLLSAGGLLLTLIAWKRSRAMRRTRYLRERWRSRDIFVVISSVLSILLTFFIRRLTPETLIYLPLPRASLPPFHLWSIALVLLLLAPAFITLLAQRSMGGPSRPPTEVILHQTLRTTAHDQV